MPAFPFSKQFDAMDCGPACLKMVAAHHGKNFSLQTLRERSFITRQGVSMLGISDAAESIGFRTLGVKISFAQLRKEVNLPCIIHWKQKHFVVVVKVGKKKVIVADPAVGVHSLDHKEFLQAWTGPTTQEAPVGLCLMLQPTPEFYGTEDERINKGGFRFLGSYIRPFKRHVFQLLLGLFIGSVIQLIFPFLTQQIVDFGINNQNLGFIYLVLIAQLVLFISRMSVDFIRSWILLHLGTRLNIALISDFLSKLTRLPISFFDSKLVGDILQRIYDHRRVEIFLTSTTLNIIFSLFSLIVFGIVLLLYSGKIFAIYLAGSLIYILWVSIFMRRRRRLDSHRFKQLAENQSKLIQLITGMQEIKLNNIEKQKRWEWESIQARLFSINVKFLSLNQYQQAGATFLNELKNILITIFAATAVISGDMTLGMLVAVQYILGQLNSPLDQMIGFFHTMQDARISLERLDEIHQKDDEEHEQGLAILSENKRIRTQGLTFQYEGPHSPIVLDQVDIDIPEKKLTAIVGVSGSGKTTLIKLLLGFYKPVKGDIRIGDINLSALNQSFWRNQCGVVMQDGFIFSDTIARNIAMQDENPETGRLLNAARIANIQEFIDTLPVGFNTKIGSEGLGLSQGQMQRILIARAVYKEPAFLFFDEATNALDANNEKRIMENLDNFFKGKTAVVVAHRLSTVKHADQILLLDRGRIAEQGTHEELTKLKGKYYQLVKDQLELGN